MAAPRADGLASRPGTQVMTAFVLSTLFAGANAVAVRFTVAELLPFWGAGLRFTTASLIFWLIVLVGRRRRPSASELRLYILYGAIGFGAGYAFAYSGFKDVPAGLGQVVLALSPLLTLLLAVLHRQEAFRWRGLIGALIALAGIGLAFVRGAGDSVPFLSLLAIGGAALCFAESGVVLKSVAKPDPVYSNAVGMTTGTLILLVLSLLQGEQWKLPTMPSTWAAVSYLGVVGSVIVFYLVVYVLGHWTASASSYQLVIMPFITVALAALLAGEQVTGELLIGAVLVLLGVWVGALSGSARTGRVPVAEPLAAEGD